MVMDKHPAIRVQKDSITHFMDDIIREDVFSIYLNNRLITKNIASPEQLQELGAGFVICEGLADHIESVRVSGNEIRVEADAKSSPELELRSCGGKGVIGVPKEVVSSMTLTPDDVFNATGEIVSDTWKKTGGVHCSVLFSAGKLVAKSCDIGRHNTVDKIVGAAELAGVDRSLCYIGCTGRQPSAMVSKAANAGIPVVISRAASTNLGIETAENAGITLICFSRENRFTVYTHPERIPEIEGNPSGGPVIP